MVPWHCAKMFNGLSVILVSISLLDMIIAMSGVIGQGGATGGGGGGEGQGAVVPL